MGEFLRIVAERQTGASGDVAWVMVRSTTVGTFHDKAIDSSAS